ncbi:hypothetical protein ID852_09760 [Xenorhabdus sp. 42]|uniref:hypothetical protein n=1 Tax=Xenorhabdus szentirmaii TaxID=290112 RepID=UPI0019B358CF|nr:MULTISPECIES: hypothetical protein [unclassified Xenorhabdus]MBD2806041.1 hypothetical protein [Xenorhabdus sp. ZM]MBD2820973.1 hypothetical protein [Xenorhabdus sp. 42]
MNDYSHEIEQIAAAQACHGPNQAVMKWHFSEETGTVVVSHLSRYAFYPRILEKDTAIRLPGDGQIGDSLADIATERMGSY